MIDETAQPAEAPTVVGPHRTRTRLTTGPRFYPVVALGIASIVAVASPGFLTTQNIKSALGSVAITGIAAIGATTVTVSGGLFSLSTGATAGCTAICYARLLEAGFAVGWALALALTLAVALGFVQGAIIAAGMNPIVTTLAVGGFLAGLVPNISEPLVQLQPGADTWLGQASVFGVTLPIVVFAVTVVVGTVFMKKTRMGRRMYLVGANHDAAEIAGLRPGVTLCLAFVAASLTAGLAGIVGSAQVGLVTMSALSPLTFGVITAVVVGGAAINGGHGSPIGTAIAAAFVGLVANLVALHGYDYGVQLTIQGVFVCLAVVGYAHLGRREGR